MKGKEMADGMLKLERDRECVRYGCKIDVVSCSIHRKDDPKPCFCCPHFGDRRPSVGETLMEIYGRGR